MNTAQQKVTDQRAQDALQRAGGGGASVGDVIAEGTTTLVAGVSPQVLVPGILATSRVIYSLQAPGASTALGTPRVTIDIGTGFVLTSAQQASPGLTQTGDLSTYAYIVVMGD